MTIEVRIGGCAPLIAIFYIILGAVEVHFARNAEDAKGECGPAIWYCVLFNGIFNIVTGAINIIAICRSIRLGEKNNVSGLSLINLGLCIWAVVCYYGSDAQCVSLFQNTFANLWQMIFIQVVLFYIMGAAVGLLILCYCCGASVDGDNNQPDRMTAFMDRV